MAKSFGESKKRASRAKVKSGCSTCKERRVKCDETLPTCQRCQRSGRVCKGLWGKTSTMLQTLAPNNTPPAANTRAMTANTEYSGLSAEAEPPISSSDSDNRQWTELTWVESSTFNTRQGRTSAEQGASAEIDASGLEKDRAKDLIWVEEPVWQRGENIHGPRHNGRPDSQGGDSGPSTSMVEIDHSTTSANSSKQSTPEGDLADGANISRRNSVVANREGSESTLTTKRTADTVPLPEARTTHVAKRARRTGDEQRVGDLIIVSSGTFGDHNRTAKEYEHPKSGSPSEASGPASQADGVGFQTGRQVSSEDRDAVQKARMALLAIGANSTDVAESRRTALSSQLGNHSNDSQPPPPSVRSSQNFQEPSEPHVPASSEQARHSSLPAPLETEQDPGRLWNPQRAGNPSQGPSIAERERRPSVSGTLRISSTVQNGQSASVRNPSPPPNGTQRRETFDNNELRITLGSSDSGPLRSMAQRTGHPDLPRASLHTPNQTSMQDMGAGSQLFQPLMINPAGTLGGNHPSSKPNARYDPDAVRDPTGSGKVNTSSNVTMLASNSRDNHRAPLPRQRNELGSVDAIETSRGEGYSFVNHNQRQSSTNSTNTGDSGPQRTVIERRLQPNEQNAHVFSPGSSLQPQSTYQPPAVTFTIDNRIQSPLHMATIESLFEVFSRNCQVLLRPRKTSMSDTVYPVDVIVWQHSANFYKWYMAETRTAKVSTLRFEVFDANWKLEKTFPIPVGNLYYFQMLKQCIWDLFWVASKLNSAPLPFKILVRPAPHLDNEALPRSPVRAERKTMNATTCGLPAERSTTSMFDNVGVVADSRPPATMIPQVYDGYPPHHNNATSNQVPFITPAPRPNGNGATLPQMHLPAAQRNRISCTTRFPERPEPFIDLSSPAQGAGASMDVAAYVPQQYHTRDTPQPLDLSSRQTAIAPLPVPEIFVRLQRDGAGKVTDPYDKSVLRPNITTTEFFAWFASQTGRGGCEGPPSLRFTFKDAMPIPTSSTIAQANEDHFNLMRKGIKAEFEKARKYTSKLKEFAILVTDPGWVSEEEGW